MAITLAPVVIYVGHTGRLMWKASSSNSVDGGTLSRTRLWAAVKNKTRGAAATSPLRGRRVVGVAASLGWQCSGSDLPRLGRRCLWLLPQGLWRFAVIAVPVDFATIRRECSNSGTPTGGVG